MLRDLGRDDPQIAAVTRIVAHVAPDILVLAGVDWDLDGLTLAALAERFAAVGHDLPHRFAGPPNAGLSTGVDLDGDGRLGHPRDAQGYGLFRGAGALAVLSRFPLDTEGLRDFTGLLWADLPGAIPPVVDGVPFPDKRRFAGQRLSSTSHWAVPVTLPRGEGLTLLVWKATPPVFDGPEDRNGRRNHDEAALWLRLLEGALGPVPEGPLAVIGGANLDPFDGDGRAEALEALLAHPRLQDPAPESLGGVAAARDQGGANARHRGDPARDTADWRDDPGPGNLRVDYILPSADLTVAGAGVFWPPPGDPLAALLDEGGTAASRHRLVWVDLVLPGEGEGGG